MNLAKLYDYPTSLPS